MSAAQQFDAEAIRDLLEGNTPPPNRIISDLVNDVKTIQAQMVEGAQRIAGLRAELTELEAVQLQRQGALTKSVQDIARWLEPAEEAEGDPAPPADAGTETE